MELSKQEMNLFLPPPGLWWKNFFNKMLLIWSKGFKIDFQNRKWNYPNRKWNYFSHLQASGQKTSFTKCFSFVPRDLKLISTAKQAFIIWYKGLKINFQNRKWNYFSYFQASDEKNFFYKTFFNWSNGFKIDFQNRKWNYFSHFQTSD